MLVIIAIIAVALIVYVKMGYRTETVPNSITSDKNIKNLQNNEKDLIVDWKTYKNDKYGFEVKYPPNMTAKNMPAVYLEGRSDIKDADDIGPGVNIDSNLSSVNINIKNSNECLEDTCLLRESSYKQYCDFYESWFVKYGITYCKINPKLGVYIGEIEKKRANSIGDKDYSVGFNLSPNYILFLNGKIIRASYSTDDLNKIFTDAVYEDYKLAEHMAETEGKSVAIALSKSENILSEREDNLLKIISTFKFTK